MANDKYTAELDALQRWLKLVAGLNSLQRKASPPTLPRPVVLWEAPLRGRDRNLGRYQYVNSVTQLGKLYVSSLDELVTLEEALLSDLEERTGLLPVYATSEKTAKQVALLKQVEITFQSAETLDVPFTVKYEVTYARTRPAPAPAATFVGNKIQGGAGTVRDYDPAEHNT